MADKALDPTQTGILGDINPTEAAKDHMGGPSGSDTEQRGEDKSTITAGSEIGGTRNYREGSGAIGGDIGNRPE
jgi:hypothetical protein